MLGLPLIFPAVLSRGTKIRDAARAQSEREKLRKQLKEKTAALAKAKERQSELCVLSRDRRKKEDTMRGLESEIVKMKRNKVSGWVLGCGGVRGAPPAPQMSPGADIACCRWYFVAAV